METLALPEWTGLFSQIEFDVTSQNERYTEVKSRFVEPGFATAEVTTVQMPGIEVSHFAFSAKESIRMNSGTTGEEVQSVFTLSGSATSNFYHMPGLVIAEKNKHSFQYSPNFAADHLIHPGRFEVVHLTFNVPFLQSLLQPTQDRLADSICNRIERKESFPMTPEHLALPPEMLGVLSAVQHCRFGGMTRLLYLEGKVLELFSLQLEQIASAKPPSGDRISRGDAEKLHAVREFIAANYLLPLSLTGLSVQFGLNEFKLKKGYKILFGTTVFGHIHSLRMGKAKALLAEGRLNVSEVSDLIGYGNVPAFSAAFRKCFGYPPSSHARPV
jgi:AraC-like DNA-binding protein